MHLKPSKPLVLAARHRTGAYKDALLATLPGVLLITTLLLGPAAILRGGQWLWLEGFAFVVAYGAISLTGNLALAYFRPAHFRVRRQSVVADRHRKQPLLDAIGSVTLIGFALAWLTFVPVDVFNLHLLPAPQRVFSWVGGILAIIGAALTPLAVWENRFATPNIQDQREQGQWVVQTGVYALIRHPIYAGNLLLFGGGALWLGSYAALAGISVLVIATIGRIALEEKHLLANVNGYAEYTRRVRSRLIPFVI